MLTRFRAILSSYRFLFLVVVLVACACPVISLAHPPEIEELFERSEINRCGPYALQASMHFLDFPVRQSEIDRILPNSGQVTSFSELAQAAKSLGFSAIAIKWENEPLGLTMAPAVLAVRVKGKPHFVAALHRSGDRVYLVNFPAADWVTCKSLREEFEWTGESLHLAKSNRTFILIYAALYWRQVALVLVAGIFFLLVAKIRQRRIRTSDSQKITILFFAICASTLAGCSWEDDPNRSQIARIVPDRLIIKTEDAGNILQEHGGVGAVIRIVNVSRDTITIKNVMVSCGCTKLSAPSKKVVNPGGESSIPLRVELPAVGKKLVSVAVVVQSGSVRQKLLAKLELHGHKIETPVVHKVPDRVVLTRDSTGRAEARVKIQTLEKSSAPEWIEAVKVNNPKITITPMEMKESAVVEPGISLRTYSYAISTVSSSSKNSSSKTSCVTLFGKGSELPVAKFYVRVEPWMPVRLIPLAFFINLVDGEKDSFERQLRIVITDRHHFQPTKIKVESDKKWLKILSAAFENTVEPTEALVAFSIDVDELSGLKRERAQLRVRLLSDQEQPFEATLPVVIRRYP